MRTLIAVLLVAFHVTTALAADCEPLPTNLWDNAKQMALITRQKIREMEELEARAGRKFTVGIIQRRGTDMDRVQLLKRVDQYGNHTTLDGFVESLVYNPDPSGDSKNLQIFQPDLVKRFDKRPLDYSHIGLIFRNHPKANPEVGEWVIVHLLDHCSRNGGGPGIHNNSINRFFADTLLEYKTKITVPDVALQEALERVVLQNNLKKNRDMKSTSYNAAALWSSEKDENSTVWPLEMIAAAMRPEGVVRNRADAIKVLKQEGYEASLVQAKGSAQLASIGWVGDMFRIDLSEHKYAKSFGIAEIATALSVDDFLRKKGRIAAEYEFVVSELDPTPIPNEQYLANKPKVTEPLQ